MRDGVLWGIPKCTSIISDVVLNANFYNNQPKKHSMHIISYSVILDIEEIEILRDRQVFNYEYDQENIELLKQYFPTKDSLYTLVKNDDQFAGFCSIDRGWWEDDYFFLREILVDPNSRGLWIGGELMKRSINHAKNCGAVWVVTETAFDNLPMQWLCEKQGLKEWDNPQWKDGITYKITF